MIEIQLLRNQLEESIKKLETRNVPEAASTVKEIISLDEKRRKSITEVEELKRQMNQVSKSIGMLMKEGKRDEAEQAKAQTATIKAQIKELEQAVSESEAAIRTHLLNLPNLPHPSVPVGHTEADNVVVDQNKIETKFDFEALPHWELAQKHNIIDWALGAKITGAGFPVYKGKGATLQRALISYFLDQARDAGYEEIQPPLLVNEASGFGTGQLPDKEGQMYHVTADNLFLIPTAEVPITNLHRDVIVPFEDLPIKNCGYTPCFRREAGSYGKDVKGLNRLHQFDKVEIVQVAHPDKSYVALQEMCDHVAALLESLGLQYRILQLCTGDLGFTAAITYDFEVFSAAQDRWLEVSSVSNFETYQTNRLKLRFRNEDKKTQLAHSLNGSALALPRIVAALLENHQHADGSIQIPEVLVPYTRFEKIG